MGEPERLDGRFELEERAGEGMSGLVYRARDLATGARVAVKVLTSETHATRFTREAQLLAKLNHPHIVRYVAHGRANKRPYLAMEWLEGEELETRLARGTLSVEQTLALARAAAGALAHAHAQGVVHRDLKPSNLFLVDGRVDNARVLDFGIAYQPSIGTRATVKGLTLGTPTYMAPEQAQGADVDARADVFALGCVLFECLAGRPAFQATNVLALMTKVLLEDPAPLSEVAPDAPHELEKLVGEMMDKRREKRPADGGVVAKALAPIRVVDRESSPPKTALTSSEQSLVSVILIGKASDHEAARVTWTDMPLPTFDEVDDDEITEMAGRATGDPVARITERYGARREFLGDGSAVVLLRSSGSATEQAIRAARCAIELRSLAGGAPVALATGLAQVGARAPVGQVIDAVVTLLGLAGDAELIVDHVTMRLLPKRFVFDRDRLLAEESAERDAAPGHRFVGREDELRQLEERLERTVGERSASVTVIRGEPGIGKSRLRRELLASVGDDVQVGFGWGDPMRVDEPYGVLALLIRSLLDLSSDGELEERRATLREALSPLFSGPDLDRIAAFLGEVTGTPFEDDVHPALRGARIDERTMRSETERALWELLENASARAPVLLVIEDLQWCDHPTTELLGAALLFVASQPFAVMAFGRDDDRFGTLWRDQGREDIELSGLSEEAAAGLAREALGPGRERLAPVLVVRAGGNPFYIEELARAIRSQPELDTLPTTVAALVRARLDRMPDDARRVLRAASILGEQFDQRALEALLGMSSDASAWLDPLVDQRVLIRVAPNALGRFAFGQALLREAAYETLTDSDRSLGHRLAAEHLARQTSPAPSALAQHYEKGGEPGRASPWWAQAARGSLEAHATERALEQAIRGIEAGADGETLNELLLLTARAGRTKGDWGLVTRAAERTLARVEPLGESWWESLRWVALAQRTQGNREVALEHITNAVNAVRTAVLDFASLAHVMRIAHTALVIGEVGPAEALLAAVDGHLPSGEIPYAALRAERLSVQAQLELFRGDLGAYLDHMKERYEIADEAGLDFTTAATAPNLGFGLILVGAYDEAEAILRAGMQLASSLRIPPVEAWTQHNLGLCLCYQGELEEALEVTLTALSYAERNKDQRLLAGTLSYLSAIHLRRGALEVAEDVAQRAATLARRVAPPAVPYAIAAQAQVMLERGAVDETLTLLAPFVSALDDGEPIEDGEAQIRLAHAEALHASGREADAKAAIERAAERLEERAAKIHDPVRRESFLHRVPHNARTFARRDGWGESADARLGE